MSDHDPFSDPFSPAPISPPPTGGPATPSAPPPAASHPPPAPVRKASESVGMSPITVFVGSYAFAGIAAVLMATAIALLVALSDFRTSALVIIAVAVAAVVVAAMILWLGLFDERGRPWARTATWAVCGLAVCAAIAVFVLQPGSSVSWFGQLTQLGAGLTIVVSVASALLLALPASNTYFQADPKPEPKPVAAWTPSRPPASPPPAPPMPTAAPDDDPFS
jgi:hypothetical protein